jgi:two-component system response regulator DegU
MKELTFLLVDGTLSYRRILHQIVQSDPTWSVVDEASNGLDATRLALEHMPDVVLIDVSMPAINGIEATRRIKQAAPKACVIAFSGHPDLEFRRQSLLAGADHYLLKEDLDVASLASLIQRLCPALRN